MSTYIPAELQRQIRSQFSNCCAYCQTAEALTVKTFELDHIQPLSANGKTILENLCLACPSCNRYKAARQTAIDPVTDLEEQLFHPYKQEWTDHFDWNNDSTEIIGLTATGRATIQALKMNRDQLIRVRRMWASLGEHPPKTSG